MMRLVNLTLIILTALAAVTVYQVKHRSDQAAERVAAAKRAVESEEEAMSLLKAEWSLLVQPARIQGLIERHADEFVLQSIEPGQIGTISAIPLRTTRRPAAQGGDAKSGGSPTSIEDLLTREAVQ